MGPQLESCVLLVVDVPLQSTRHAVLPNLTLSDHSERGLKKEYPVFSSVSVEKFKIYDQGDRLILTDAGKRA